MLCFMSARSESLNNISCVEAMSDLVSTEAVSDILQSLDEYEEQLEMYRYIRSLGERSRVYLQLQGRADQAGRDGGEPHEEDPREEG